ncbi:MAG TPA: hypothetical protein VG273_16490 [Bryobacteraceae bacterium]|jgi:hypothetical protein|nr:hypothetical protein [Bryobacteraceae bacterium]
MTPTATVSASGNGNGATPASPAAPAQPAAGAPPAAAAASPDAAGLQKQVDELRAQLTEKENAAQFWHDRAQQHAQPAKQDAAPAADDDVDILELITTKGSKGLDEYIAKKGFVRADEVDKRVNAKATAVQKEQELMGRYPGLKDRSSDFFKQTALHYGTLVKSGVAESVAMEVAAERTELQLMRDGKIKPPTQQQEDREAERRRRAAAQAGDTGNRGQGGDEEDEELTSDQKQIVRAMGITEESYKERAKKGVAMKGVR